MPRLDAILRLWSRLVSSGGNLDVLDTDSFTESERIVGRMALPVLDDLQAARMLIEELEAKVRATDVVLALIPVPAIVLDPGGRLLSANDAARELFGGPAIPLHVVVAAARAVTRGVEHESVTAPHPGGQSRMLRIVPAQVNRGADAPAVAFLLPSDQPVATISPGPLQSRLGLTRMQASVVALVAQGLSNREVGERLRLSIETVRTHLSAAYARVGVSNRAAIVALAFGVRFADAGEPPLAED